MVISIDKLMIYCYLYIDILAHSIWFFGGNSKQQQKTCVTSYIFFRKKYHNRWYKKKNTKVLIPKGWMIFVTENHLKPNCQVLVSDFLGCWILEPRFLRKITSMGVVPSQKVAFQGIPPWKNNGWFTYSHHPFFERKMIWTKPPCFCSSR